MKTNNYYTEYNVRVTNGFEYKNNNINGSIDKPVYLPAVKRLIAIGDIHGDYDLAVESFKLAKLIDDNLNWIANPLNTVVVQVGDQIDSCRPIPGVYNCHNDNQPNDKNDDIKVMHFFNEMDIKARMHGGAVYSLLGNHEILNTNNKFNYVSYNNYYNFYYKSVDGTVYSGPNGRCNAFKPGGPIAKMMALTRSSVLIIGNTMFAHAGVLPILVDTLNNLQINNMQKLKYINNVIRDWLSDNISKNDVYAKNIFTDNVQMSPFWTRVYGLIPKHENIQSTSCKDVKNILQIYGLKQLIVGHTPQLFTHNDGINGTCFDENTNQNTLYRVDGGFSQSFKIFGDHNVLQVLEILDDKIFNILTYNTQNNIDSIKIKMKKHSKFPTHLI